MKFNFSDYFSVSQKDLDDFSLLDGIDPDALPPLDGLSKLLAAKEALSQIVQFRQGKAYPSSFGQLVELISTAFSVSRFKIPSLLNVNASIWRQIIFNTSRPDILPACVFSKFAKLYRIPFSALKKALLGSFHLVASGGPVAGTVYTRSDCRLQNELTAAVEELLQKGASSTDPTSDSKVQSFLHEVESCMKQT